MFCNKEEKGKYYIEDFKIFLEKFLEICRDGNKSDLIFLICFIIFYSFILFLHNFFALSILKNLYPEYYFFTDPIRLTFIRIIHLFHN